MNNLQKQLELVLEWAEKNNLTLSEIKDNADFAIDFQDWLRDNYPSTM